MIIKKTAVGNENEAFIESDFSPNFNIISSDDNNKGKTILTQSTMYALGNEPTFPSSFDYKNYYYYVEFEENKTIYKICRYNNSFILKCDDNLMILENISELKRYWNKNIFNLPKIIKNQLSKIVDPVLFVQLFFVGQDKKDTSNISHHGLYNKQDFINMIFSYCNIGNIYIDDIEIDNIKKRVNKLKNEKGILLKQHKILKSDKPQISYLSSENDRISFANKLRDMEELRIKIEELKKTRNRALTRKAKWDTTLKELKSLNIAIDEGELRCMDCNSTNISFVTSKKKGYSFDVSTTEMRKEIIDSISEKSQMYEEEISIISAEIEKAQDEFRLIIQDDSVSLESILAFKTEFLDASETEQKIKRMNEELDSLQSKLKLNSDNKQHDKKIQDEIIESIVSKMNDAYHAIDPMGNLSFIDIFTKKDEVFSGSESTIYHIVKLYALKSVLNHNLPIIIDSFRAEDLSTQKESNVIELFMEFKNQIIFTTTLKKEEIGKYDDLKNINHINYTNHTPSKMLNDNYLIEFKKLLRDLSIEL